MSTESSERSIAALVEQLGSEERRLQAAAYCELHRLREAGLVRANLTFLHALGATAHHPSPRPFALRLLADLVWGDDELRLFDHRAMDRSRLRWELRVSHELARALGGHQDLAGWMDPGDRAIVAFACGVCLDLDQSVINLLEPLASDADERVRDTANVSRAAHVARRDVIAPVRTEPRMASLVADALVRRELTEDALLAVVAPYDGLWYSPGEKADVWLTMLRCLIRECSDPATQARWISQVVELAPSLVRDDAELDLAKYKPTF